MDYRFKTKPFKHQLTALEKSWSKQAWAWFMEMGTGKTKVCIDNIAMLFDRGKINRALVIAPNGIKRNWRKELSVHMPDHIEYIDSCLGLHLQRKKEKDRAYEQYVRNE